MTILTLRRQDNRTVCDFCSGQQDIYCVYTCGHFTHKQMQDQQGRIYHIGVASDLWNACATCAILIDRGDWEGLAFHCHNQLVKKYGEQPGWKQRIRALHSQFRTNKGKVA